MSLLDNIKNRGFKDILSPKHWWFFIKAKFERNWEDRQAEVEQIIYRESLCPQCFAIGKCIGTPIYLGEDIDEQCGGCGCPSPELFHEKQMVCACGKWPEMMKANDWNQYKKETGMELIIKYT
jgi:hypothetical protein